MQNKKSIVHHIRKHKERIIAHINKHHKKYLFGAGMAFGITALKLIAIAGIFFGINLTIGKSNAANEKLDMYKNIETLSKIDDFVHKEIRDHAEGGPFATQEMKDMFYKIDTAYHQADNINEEYRAIKDMVDLLKSTESDHFNDIQYRGEGDVEEPYNYRKLLEDFDKIK